MTKDYDLKEAEKRLFTLRNIDGKVLGMGEFDVSALLRHFEIDEEELEEKKEELKRIKYLKLGSIDTGSFPLTVFMKIKLTETGLEAYLYLRLQQPNDPIDILIPTKEVNRFFKKMRRAVYYTNKIEDLNNIDGRATYSTMKKRLKQREEWFYNLKNADDLYQFLSSKLYNTKLLKDCHRTE